MIIHNRQNKINIGHTLQINGEKLQQVESSAYLGIIIDENLNWKQQIQKICKQVSPKIGILAKLRHYVPNNILKMLYNS